MEVITEENFNKMTEKMFGRVKIKIN